MKYNHRFSVCVGIVRVCSVIWIVRLPEQQAARKALRDSIALIPEDWKAQAGTEKDQWSGSPEETATAQLPGLLCFAIVWKSSYGDFAQGCWGSECSVTILENNRLEGLSLVQ